jgi:hypothetical protein
MELEVSRNGMEKAMTTPRNQKLGRWKQINNRRIHEGGKDEIGPIIIDGPPE